LKTITATPIRCIRRTRRHWTIDKLHAYVKDVYSDINTNDKLMKDDRFGLMLNNYNNIDVLFYGAGLRVTDRDEDEFLI
jgi:uncharacterized protein (DUF488 family)